MKYDPETGILSWIVNKGSASKGKVSRTKSCYITHMVDHKDYKATHIIWLYVYGHLPSNIIDHINGDIKDNRISNLREVTLVENNRNCKNKSNSHSRFKGAAKSKNGYYQVQIRHDNKQTYIGRYKSEIEAAYWYDMASIQYHGEFGRRNFLPLVT